MRNMFKSGLMSSALIKAVALSALVAPTVLGNSVSAQEISGAGTVRGKVTDKARGGKLQGALVKIPALNLSEAANREGTFTFRNVPAGEYEVVVSYQGKEDEKLNVTVAANQSSALDVQLSDLGTALVQEAIVITASPIADSEAAAFSRQKASDKLINVVAADSIGRFPDQNVAGALSRLPGVSVERDQGQERYVNLRGAPNKWTTISFDGVNVVSPEGRASRFDTIPNSIVSSIEAIKAVTPDMSAESIAGNINIVTRSPFDHEGLKVSGEAAIGLLELGTGEQTNVSFTLSNTFMDGKLGFLISGSAYERNQVTDNVENRFEIANEDQADGREDRIWSRQTDTRVYNLVRANTALNARVDYRPGDDHQFYIQSTFTEFTDDELRDQFIFDYDSDASNGCYADISCASNATPNTPTVGTVYGAQIDATFNTNDYKENIWTTTLGGDHFVADWDVSWRLNYAYTEDQFYAPARYLFNSPSSATERPSVFYDYTDPDYPVTIPYETIDNGDGTYSLGERWSSIGSEHLNFTQAEKIDIIDPTRAWTGKVDIERSHSLFSLPATSKFGFQYDTRSKSGKRTDTLIRPDSLAAAGLDSPTLFDIQQNRNWNGGFPNYWASLLYDHAKAVEFFANADAAGGSFIQEDESEESFYRVKEDIISLYGMTTLDFDWGSVVAGVRVEQSENEGEAFGQVNGGPFETFTASDDRIDVFPSVHVNYDITDEQKFRLSFNTGLARPDFDERAPNFSINDDAGDESISGGNPFAKPERTYGVDAYYEWYLKPVGILSAGVFYKHIQDPLVDVNTIFGSTQFDEADLLRSQYEFNTIGNGKSGYYTGIELAYAQQFDFLSSFGLPEWTDGFGFNGNLTMVDSEIELEDGRQVPLGGSSDLTYNTSVYWERNDFSIRANWQWRTEWINAYGSEERFDRYWAELGRLSIGARYQMNDNLEWFFDANNLTDQLGRRIRGDMSRVYEVEGFGARYMTGLRFNF